MSEIKLHPNEKFEPDDYRYLNVKYLLEHPEITTLATLFVSHITRKRIRDHQTLMEASYFFTRSIKELEAEIKAEMARNRRLGPKLIMKPPEIKIVKVPEDKICTCPLDEVDQIDSFYSSFISVSTSETTLPPDDFGVLPTPTIDEIMRELILRALNNGLNSMYATKERLVLYDEAYMCIMKCIQAAVEEIWIPRLAVINYYIDKMLDDVKTITTERRRQMILATDKLPRKIHRLFHNFNGFGGDEDYSALKKQEVIDTFKSRKCTYNRYPKDQFGVYLSSWDKSFDESSTHDPHRDIDEEDSSQNELSLEEESASMFSVM